tara:strand:- start:1393 stop:2412 length:1020 start_codon:yes stop_codon:yes gene_type:complete
MTLSHRLRAAAGASSGGYDDSMYNNFFTSGASALDFSSNTKTQAWMVSNSNQLFRDAFYDSNLNRVWNLENSTTSYETAGYLPSYPAATKSIGSSISNTDYKPSSTSYTYLTSYTSNSDTQYMQAGPNSRNSVSIGFLQDNTPVVFYPTFTSTLTPNKLRIYFWNYTTGARLGHMNLNLDGTNQVQSSMQSYGVNRAKACFDGSGIILALENQQYAWKYDMPADTSALTPAGSTTSNTISAHTRWTLQNTIANDTKAIVWAGDGIIYIYGSPSVSGFSHDIFSTGTGLSQTTSLNYSISNTRLLGGPAIDYKHRVLVFPESLYGTGRIYNNYRSSIYEE